MNVVFEEDGVVILATSSSVPGVMIVPPGKTMEDAKPVTNMEFKKLLDDREKEAAELELTRPEPVNDLTKLVTKLQSDIEILKRGK